MLRILILLTSLIFAKDFREVDINKATLLQKHNKLYCNICGMKLNKFYKTNHAAKYKNNFYQYCSIVCEIEDMVVNNKKLSNFLVVDTNNLKFIDTNKAYFIVGSKKIGTMSKISKYAFSNKKDALIFQKENGGKLMNFQQVINLVKKNNKEKFIFAKKLREKNIKKGALLYKLCKRKTIPYNSLYNIFNYINTSNICPDLNDDEKFLVSIYIEYIKSK